MRSNRVATLAVVTGLALLGSVSAGVSGITAGDAAPMRPATVRGDHHHDGDHHEPHAEHAF